MKKQILFFAVAALALASCSSDKIAEEKQVAQQQAEPGAVLFEAYTQRGVTRAGTVGTLTTDGMKTGAFKDDGFGVFGYYTDNNTYDKLYLPNFMYNEQVKWDGSSAWTYEPVKYWPNEYGNTAMSDDQDKVSFFAYAPWVDVVPTTGKLSGDAADQKWGITGMTRNTATGDPLIKYLVAFDPAHSVDLCWGVCDEDIWAKVVDGGNQTFEKGKPWIDVQRPANAVDQKLKFTFKHATSQLNVQVDAYVDGTDNTKPIADGSKVYIRSITFEGFATQGTLNLNNTDVMKDQAYWLDYAGTNDIVTGESVTIYDGRKDGKEGTQGGEATNEKVLGLNPQLIQSDLWSKNATTGVTSTTVNLFRKWNPTGGAELKGAYEAAGLLEPIYVIPTGDNVKVTIVYDIETEDSQLATYLSDAETNGSSIPNVITKEINFGENKSLENGKSYILKLHLGLNSVKFDADVTEWKYTTGAEADLPANVPVFTAADAGTESVTLPAQTTSYTYGVNGLTPNESTTVTNNGNVNITVANGKANSAGIALTTATITPNMTPYSVTSNPVVTGNSSGKKLTLAITQQPHALGLSVQEVKSDAIILKTDADVDWNNDVEVSAGGIKVSKNGTQLAYESGDGLPTTASQFRFIASTHKINLKDNPTAGDVYEIKVKAGEADEETYTFRVCSISFANAGLVTIPYNSTYTNNLINTGSGEVTYSKTYGNCTLNTTTGEVTATSSTGSNTITATVADDALNGCFYLTKEAKYNVQFTTATAKIYFDETTVSGTIAALGGGTGKYTQTAHITGDGTVTYDISDGGSLASIDHDSGELTFAGGTGTVTITATVTGYTNYTYSPATATYKITIE